MSGRRKTGKAKIEMSMPELPTFLIRMREQMVANEESERKEMSLKKRKERSEKGEKPDDDPTIVKLSEDDLTEEEYKRMKFELETQYKLDRETKSSTPEELNIDQIISSGKTIITKASETCQTPAQSSKSVHNKEPVVSNKTQSKNISYDSSSEDEGD